MESASFTLDDLTNLFDDVEPQEHDDTPNNGVPTLGPPPAGKYGVQLLSIGLAKDKNGEVLDKLKFTADVLVVDAPAEAAFMQDKKIRFLSVSGKSKVGRDDNGQPTRFVELFRLARGFDRSFNAHGSVPAALAFLIEQIQTNGTASIQIDWKAWDTAHATVTNFMTLEPKSEEKKRLYKEIDFKGTRWFQKDGTMVNPASGSLLKARPYIKYFYAATNA